LRRTWHHRRQVTLRRRLFVWFGVAIGVTALVSSLLFAVFGPGVLTYDHARAFVGDQFAATWDEPARRDALAEALARDFAVRVEVDDRAGHPVAAFGGACRRLRMTVPVARNGETLGVVRLCEEHRFGPPMVAPFFVAVVVLWGVSGAVARRLLRPLGELTRVASDIGRGQLGSRVRIGNRYGTEFLVVGQVMNEMAARIEKQLADQRALLATVSHEIRTPLSRMRLLIEFARGKLADLADVGELDQLEREIAEIDALVSDLLASSRIDFSAVNKTRLDAGEIGKTALERAGIDISRLVPPSATAAFEGDATLVMRAVQNLVDNAQRHGGGLDSLRVETSSSFVSFVVEDRGSGFEPGEETRIFEPFYRGATSDAAAAGLGLGLALVKRIAEAHGGHVYANNRKDAKGAQVAVAFARPSR
jgi:signal transduction histidine kinase